MFDCAHYHSLTPLEALDRSIGCPGIVAAVRAKSANNSPLQRIVADGELLYCIARILCL